VTKRPVDIDDAVLEAARAELGTSTIKATVDAALKLASGSRKAEVADALDVLACARLVDRSDAWR
jgi:Arc/MetJ family transcription regulator